MSDAVERKGKSEPDYLVDAKPAVSPNDVSLWRDRMRDQLADKCPKPPVNPNKPDFDLANLTYTLTDLNWDGDRGVWDEEMETKYLQVRRNLHSICICLFVFYTAIQK